MELCLQLSIKLLRLIFHYAQEKRTRTSVLTQSYFNSVIFFHAVSATTAHFSFLRRISA